MKKNKIIRTPSRQRATFYTTLSNYSGIALAIVQGLVLVPVYFHFFDSRLYGAWLATGNIVGYLGLLNFGFNNVIIQKVADKAGKKDLNQLGKLIGTSLWIILCISLLPFIFGLLLYTYVPGWINLDGADGLQLGYSFLIASAATSLMFVVFGVGGILLGLQWVGVVSIQYIITSVIAIGVNIMFLFMDFGIMSIPLGLLFRAVVLSVGHCIYFWWLIKDMLPKSMVVFDRVVFKDLLQSSSLVFTSTVLTQLSRFSDNFIVSAIIDPKVTAILSLTKMASEILSNMSTRISSAIMPSIAHLLGDEDGSVRAIFHMMLTIKICLMMGMFSVGGYMILNEEFLKLWVGQEFYGGHMVTVLLSVSSLILILNSVIFNNLFALGEITITSNAMILESVVRVPLSVAMCYFWGLEGIVLAGVIAVLPTSLLIQVRCFKSKLNITWTRLFHLALIFIGKISVPVIAGGILQFYWTQKGVTGFISFIALYSLFTICYYLLIEKDLQKFSIKILTRTLGK